MYYYFWKDGTYSREKDPTKEMEFGIVDISTQRKGPIVAFTKNEDESFEKMPPLYMRMEMTYDTPDVPFDAQTAFEHYMKMNHTNHAYNAYPLIKQMIACNDFINGQSSFMDSHIYINKLILESKKGNFVITEDNSDQDIADMFQHMGIKTDMSEVVKPGFCIMMNNRGYWKRVMFKDNNSYADYLYRMRWTRALICFPEMETAYNMRYNTLRELERVKEFSVKVTYTPVPDNYSLSYFDALESPYENEYSATGITDILRMCIFVPQIIYIEQTLYNMDATIELNMVEDDQNIKLTITKKESRCGINTCIYNLMERLLKINMERRDVKEEWLYEQAGDGEFDEKHRRTM